jgi:hypothetical protein
MNARWSVLALAIFAFCLVACGGGDPSSAKKDEVSSSPGYDLPTPPADDEKKK